MIACSTFFFSGCVIPADGYYSAPYYHSSVVVVPALPYTVNLYDRAYYNYRGYYYFYNNQRWYYSRNKSGHWIALPRTHWPHDTKWRGHHFYHDHHDHKSGRQKNRPPQKTKHHSQKNPPRHDKYQQKKDPRYKNSYREDSRRPHKSPKPKEKIDDEKKQKKKSSKKRTMDPRQHDPKKMKRDRNNHKQRNMHPPKNKQKQHKDGKKRTEDEIYPNKPEFERRRQHF